MKNIKEDCHNIGTKVPIFSRHSGASGIKELLLLYGTIKIVGYEEYKGRLS